MLFLNQATKKAKLPWLRQSVNCYSRSGWTGNWTGPTFWEHQVAGPEATAVAQFPELGPSQNLQFGVISSRPDPFQEKDENSKSIFKWTENSTFLMQKKVARAKDTTQGYTSSYCSPARRTIYPTTPASENSTSTQEKHGWIQLQNQV